MRTTKKKIAWFQQKLFEWVREGNTRSFPWRQNRDRYRVLLSEMMLRRTRADQVAPIYERFIAKYPTLRSLANASSKDIRNELKPLGLEWRTENMISLVAEVQSNYGGKIPVSKDKLLTLPGVGQYVAAAVKCFVDNQPELMIDTNIVRIIGRFFGLSLHGEARRRKEVIELVSKCIDHERPMKYHYGLIDFGALVCSASKPKCTVCPLASRCAYYKTM